MNGSAFYNAFSAIETYASAEIFTTSSQEVNTSPYRLEGAFYGSSGYKALQQMKRSGFPAKTVGDRARIIWLGPFARTYVDNLDTGVPFLSSSEILGAKLAPRNHLSRVFTRNLADVLVKEGTILVSRSGTVGNVTICSADFEGKAVSEHAIRILAENSLDKGIIYALLQSKVGQFLVKRNRSGSVVESIYEADIADLPIPLLPKTLRQELTRLVDEFCVLRVQANRILDEVQKQVQRSCYLPDLSSFVPKSLFISGNKGSVFISRHTERFARACQFGELRLDATYHDPVAVAVAKHILSSEGGCMLGSLVREIRNSALRKRIYVDDPSAGVPLLGGKQMMQWWPKDVNYLSKALTRNLQNETVGNGWTLVSCGGTLGRVMYVHRNFERWAASQHVMRIIPDMSKAFPGFIYAFLASPYGQVQIQQRSYGSVIPEIRDFQFQSIAVRLPKDRGEGIHNKVVEAFDIRADARNCEDQAINLFTDALSKGQEYVESEWGEEY